MENDETALQLHFKQKASSEEAPQEESAPAYRTFLPEHEEEDSFYSAPKLLEEEEQGEESFEIEVRKYHRLKSLRKKQLFNPSSCLIPQRLKGRKRMLFLGLLLLLKRKNLKQRKVIILFI